LRLIATEPKPTVTCDTDTPGVLLGDRSGSGFVKAFAERQRTNATPAEKPMVKAGRPLKLREPD